MNPIQSSTQSGLIVRVAAADLTGKEGYLAKLVDATGEATCDLSGDGEQALFVIEEGAASGGLATLRPLLGNGNVRIISGNTIAGAVPVASSSTGVLMAAASGDWVIGITEEDSASGNYTLVRPVGGYFKA